MIRFMNDTKDKFIEKIFRKVGKTIHQFSLLKPGDKILVALSGGKDSMILLEALKDRMRHIPFPIDLHAVHIKTKGMDYKVDEQYLTDFCKKLEIPLIFEDIYIDSASPGKKQICFICSWNRRKAIFQLARELKCNKIAFGHHLDDAVETLLLNMIFHGSISSLPQKIDFFGGEIQIIRPLLMLKEEELIRFSEVRKYRAQIKSCPYENNTKRKVLKDYTDDLLSLHTNAKINIFRSMSNIYTEYLPER